MMASSCTNSDCSSNNFIAKCTASANPECYAISIIVTADAKPLTQWGCTDTALTTTILPAYEGASKSETSTSTSSSSLTTSSTTPSVTSPPLPSTEGSSKANNTPAIIGGVIGGLVVVGALVFGIVYLIMRDRKRKRELQAQQSQQHPDWSPGSPAPTSAVTEYHPDGFIGCNVYGEPIGALSAGSDDGGHNWKAWSRVDRDKKGAQDRVTSCGVGLGAGGQGNIYGFVEAEARTIHEAPA